MTLDSQLYNEDYFEHGEEKGISGYTDYRWMPTRTLTTASEIIRRARIGRGETILDYGASKGFMVKAFRWLGYQAFGADISSYALAHADPEVKQYLYHPTVLPESEYDIVLCKDTAEHIPYKEIDLFLGNLFLMSRHKTVLVVPLGDGNGKFIIPKFEKDITHQIREPREWWLQKIRYLSGRYVTSTDDVKDIKPNWNVPDANLYIEVTK